MKKRRDDTGWMKRLLWVIAALLLLAAGCAGTPVKAVPRVRKEAPAVVRPAPRVTKPVAAGGTARAGTEVSAAGETGRTLEPETTPAASAFVRVDPAGIPALTDDADPATLRRAVEKSLAYYDRASAGTVYRFGDRIRGVADMKASLAAFLDILNGDGAPEDKWLAVRERFDFYRSVGSDDQGRVTVTGYYEPILTGALKRTERFRYPLYRTPEDTVTVNLGLFRERFGNERLVGRLKKGEVVPHYRRSEIDQGGVLAGRNLEIAWVDDPVELFFLHVQGSGIIRLPDGGTVRVNYAQKNGWPFRGLAKFLFDEGKISASEMSHQGIVDYLHAHPEEAGDIMSHNESYVFFRRVEDGPLGALGFPVTDGRSIAVDLELFPRGALAFLKARKPRFEEGGIGIVWEPLNRFVLVQDTGGVFKGPGKADLFCGTGPEAGRTAGSMKEAGELYLLILKDDRGA